jgi:hypothetical protein
VIEEEKKTIKPTKSDNLELDVEKAKREDLRKNQNVFPADSVSKTTYQVPQNKEPLKSEIRAHVDPKKQTEQQNRRQENYRATGATTNNKITERNQKNAKDKDCLIY